jgi:hypothetical protein
MRVPTTILRLGGGGRDGIDAQRAQAYRPLMDESQTCALCGDPIDVGQAWMRADAEGAELRAHSGCVYRDETEAASARWEPTEGTLERG